VTPLRGWAVRGKCLIGKAPFGHWNTMKSIAALHKDGIVAPWVIDGPINGETFRPYVEQVLVPALRPKDIVNLDNLGSHPASNELAFHGGFWPPGFPRGGFPGFPPGIHPGQIVIPQAADLTHEFRQQHAR